jgi:hypothetical protein
MRLVGDGVLTVLGGADSHLGGGACCSGRANAQGAVAVVMRWRQPYRRSMEGTGMYCEVTLIA